MKKIHIFISIIMIILLSQNVLALKFSQSSITQEIEPKSTKTIQLTLTNDKNLTEEINVFSTNEDIATASPTNFTLSSGSSKTINVYLTSPGTGTYTAELVIVATSDIYRIPITITSTQEGTLEPTFSKLILTVEPDTITTRTISFRNKYNDRIEIKDIQVLNAITTQEGTRPIAVKSAQLGWLDPGKDLTVEIEINTKNLDYPKTYNPTLVVVYYYKDERYESDVQFQVNVQKTLTTVSKTMNLVLSPSDPKPGDKISAILIGENNETIAGKIFVTIYDSSGNKISQFQFISPFIVESGKKYCFKGEAEYYETVTKCITPKYSYLHISFSNPNPLPNETIIIKVIDESGNVVPNAKLTIDGHQYNIPQITAMLDIGTHTIMAEAPGAEPISTTIQVLPELKILNITEKPVTNKPVTILFSREVDYSIIYENKTLLNGTSDNITFIPKKSGIYTILYDGDSIKLKVEESQFFGFPNIEVYFNEQTIYILIIIVILIVVILFKFRSKKKASYITLRGSGIKSPLKRE